MQSDELAWGDLRFVLAVAREGSFSAAARTLKVNHATVHRRIRSIEKGLGSKLFERTNSGYRCSPSGELVAAAAAEVEKQLADLERAIVGKRVDPRGVVKVTTTDSLYLGLLAPVLQEFSLEYPQIEIELELSNKLFDLAARQADVALRPSNTPPESMIGQRIGRLEQAVFSLGDRPSITTEEFDQFTWIGPESTMRYQPLERWMSQIGAMSRSTIRVDSVWAMAMAATLGDKLAVLPVYVSRSFPALRQNGAPIAELATDLWLLLHPDVKSAAHIRALMDFLGPRLRSALNTTGGKRANEQD